MLQLKSYSPCEGSPYRKSLESRSSTDMDSSKLGLSSAPALNGVSPELSINGTSSPCFDRTNTKGELLSRYLPISPDHEVVPATPDARQRQQSSSYALPDYTRFSPAKIALRRHLNQDPTASAHLRGPGLTAHRLVGIKSSPFSRMTLFIFMFSKLLLKAIHSAMVAAKCACFSLCFLGKWVVLTLHLEPNRTAPLPIHVIPRILLKVLRG